MSQEAGDEREHQEVCKLRDAAHGDDDEHDDSDGGHGLIGDDNNENDSS